jgi:hypothetical protein
MGLINFIPKSDEDFYIYSESELELVSEHVVVQHLPLQHLITNPNAIKESPKLLKQPQHALHTAVVQVLPIKAKVNKYDPNTKQTKSQAPAK